MPATPGPAHARSQAQGPAGSSSSAPYRRRAQSRLLAARFTPLYSRRRVRNIRCLRPRATQAQAAREARTLNARKSRGRGRRPTKRRAQALASAAAGWRRRTLDATTQIASGRVWSPRRPRRALAPAPVRRSWAARWRTQRRPAASLARAAPARGLGSRSRANSGSCRYVGARGAGSCSLDLEARAGASARTKVVRRDHAPDPRVPSGWDSGGPGKFDSH